MGTCASTTLNERAVYRKKCTEQQIIHVAAANPKRCKREPPRARSFSIERKRNIAGVLINVARERAIAKAKLDSIERERLRKIARAEKLEKERQIERERIERETRIERENRIEKEKRERLEMIENARIWKIKREERRIEREKWTEHLARIERERWDNIARAEPSPPSYGSYSNGSCASYSADGSDRGECFNGDAHVVMADGSHKTIRELKLGDVVQSFPHSVSTVECLVEWRTEKEKKMVNLETGVIMRR